jgi:hypothetical protein
MIRSARAPHSAAGLTKPQRRLWPEKALGYSPAARAYGFTTSATARTFGIAREGLYK